MHNVIHVLLHSFFCLLVVDCWPTVGVWIRVRARAHALCIGAFTLYTIDELLALINLCVVTINSIKQNMCYFMSWYFMIFFPWICCKCFFLHYDSVLVCIMLVFLPSLKVLSHSIQAIPTYFPIIIIFIQFAWKTHTSRIFTAIGHSHSTFFFTINIILFANVWKMHMVIDCISRF